MVSAVVAVGSASLAVGASPAIQQPARVGDQALRVAPSYEPDLTPEQRAIVDLVDLINVERARRGLPNLHLTDLISAAARVHATDMAATRRMRHAGSDGSDGGTRLTRVGYAWSSWGENIGAGFRDPAELFTAWMNSGSHRDNLLGNFSEVGIAVVTASDGVPYWSLLLANPR